MTIGRLHYKGGEQMVKFVKYLLDLTVFLITGRGPIADRAVQENLLDFGGQE